MGRVTCFASQKASARLLSTLALAASLITFAASCGFRLREGSYSIAVSCPLRNLRRQSPFWRTSEERRTDQDARAVVSDFGNAARATGRSRDAARDSEKTLAERHGR